MLLPETQAECKCHGGCFARRRQLILSGLDAIPQLSYVKPLRRFLCDGGCVEDRTYRPEFALRLLEEQFVATVPAIGLGDTCGDFIRISYAASEEDIAEGLRRIRTLIEKTWRIKNEGEEAVLCFIYS